MSLGKDHRVELEPYSGPLDLLLWLIRQEEVDIHDIPISRILDRYLEMLGLIQALDLDEAGEFLVMASTLMQVKARALLPRDEPLADEDLDPRFELVQKLLEYRKFKEISEELSARADEWSQRQPPGPPPERPGIPADELPLGEVSVWDLAFAFQRVMSEVGVKKVRPIVYDELPIEVHIEGILTRLNARTALPFVDLFPPEERERTRVVGVFLALLELIRQGRVQARQSQAFGPIEVALREADEKL